MLSIFVVVCSLSVIFASPLKTPEQAVPPGLRHNSTFHRRNNINKYEGCDTVSYILGFLFSPSFAIKSEISFRPYALFLVILSRITDRPFCKDVYQWERQRYCLRGIPRYASAYAGDQPLSRHFYRSRASRTAPRTARESLLCRHYWSCG
jgi:hypothetical protein